MGYIRGYIYKVKSALISYPLRMISLLLHSHPRSNWVDFWATALEIYQNPVVIYVPWPSEPTQYCPS